MIPAYIDTSVPLYAGGIEHHYREPALRVLALASERPLAFVSSAAVLQEMLHRYVVGGVWARGSAVFSAFSELMDGRLEPVLAEDVLLAAQLADTSAGATARGLLHAAVMRRLGVTRVISMDRGFEAIEGVARLDPALIEAWESTLS